MLLVAVSFAFASDLHVVDPYTTDTLSPLHDPAAAALDLVFDRLYAPAADGTGMVGRLVARDEAVDDGTAVRITLRADATWHDGRPVTAADVCFTVEARRESDAPTIARSRYDLAGCEVEGALTATLRLARKVPEPRQLLAFHVLPAHRFPAGPRLAADDPEWGAPLGSGPMSASPTTSGWKLVEAPASWRAAPVEALVVTRPGDPVVAARAAIKATGEPLPPVDVDLWPIWPSCPNALDVPAIRVLRTLELEARSQVFANADARRLVRDGINRIGWCKEVGRSSSFPVADTCSPAGSLFGTRRDAPAPPLGDAPTTPIRVHVPAALRDPTALRAAERLAELGFRVVRTTATPRSGGPVDVQSRSRPYAPGFEDPALWFATGAPFRGATPASADLDAAIEAWSVSTDDASRERALGRIDEIVYDQAWIVPLAVEIVRPCVNADRVAAAEMPPFAPFAFFERWIVR